VLGRCIVEDDDDYLERPTKQQTCFLFSGGQDGWNDEARVVGRGGKVLRRQAHTSL
jgi:hypothetical protein